MSHGELHAGIIMDGNGRWARARGLPRVAGHKSGANAVRRVIEAAPELGIGVLTLYAFSSDNWRRPAAEVSALMRLFGEYLGSETPECVQKGVRLVVIGRRDRLHPRLVAAIEAAETATMPGSRLLLRIAIDYSSRDAIVSAAALACRAARNGESGEPQDRGRFAEYLAQAMHAPSVVDVDLLIRTGGEQRISDFLLWECAYAELYFTPRMWPDFSADDLAVAVEEFHRRERRFGGVPQPVVGQTSLLTASPTTR
jgi:undecaprenyl diphosphate synthase